MFVSVGQYVPYSYIIISVQLNDEYGEYVMISRLYFDNMSSGL